MDYYIFWICRNSLDGSNYVLRTAYPLNTNLATLTVGLTNPSFFVVTVTNGFQSFFVVNATNGYF